MILDNFPSTLSLYRKIIFGSKKGIPKEGRLQNIKIQIKDLILPQALLENYNILCGFDIESIPLTFPYALAGPLHLALIADKQFPIKPAGLLHIRNHIVQLSDIQIEQKADLSVEVCASRFRPQGFEFDIKTTLSQSGEEKWTCISTLLKRGKFDTEDPASEQENIFEKLEDSSPELLKFNVPKNVGKLYARLCKDYNPIHISVLMAKLFGFKRSIAHGMWVSAAALAKVNQPQANKFDLAFKGPVFTGSEVIVKKGDDGHYNCFTSGNERPVILMKLSG